MVRVFQTFANERQLKKLIASVEVTSAKDYTPQRGDGDYRPKDDTPWIKRFAADGGKVIISGDTRMRYVPHERLALVEAGLLVFFFDGKWSEWGFFHKCSLLIHHWPAIASRIKRTRSSTKAAFWQIPLSWSEKAKLRKTSLDDPRKLKFERRAKKKPSRIKPQTVESDMQETLGPQNFFHLLGRPDDAEENPGT